MAGWAGGMIPRVYQLSFLFLALWFNVYILLLEIYAYYDSTVRLLFGEHCFLG